MARTFLTSAALMLAIAAGGMGVRALGDDAPPAAEPVFKNEQANKAVEADKAAEAKAKADYDKVVIAAKKTLIATLEPLMEKATRAGDLDEAVKLRDNIAALKKEVATMTGLESKVVGVWDVVASGGHHGPIQINADGSALADNVMKGRWSIEKGNLVIRWSDPTNINIYTSGSNDVMTGKSSVNNQSLTATRISK